MDARFGANYSRSSMGLTPASFSLRGAVGNRTRRASKFEAKRAGETRADRGETRAGRRDRSAPGGEIFKLAGNVFDQPVDWTLDRVPSFPGP